MKSIITIISLSLAFLVIAPRADAQMMQGSVVQDDHTAREEVAGKEVWQKLQNKEIECAAISDDAFESLGEYFMGQMVGNSHAAMNQMMMNMMGEEGERQMHQVMGRRLSGCDTDAAFPAQGIGFMPMMSMMWGGWSSPYGSNQSSNYTPMMWGNNAAGWGFSFLGPIFMILWWGLIIVVIVALVRWSTNQSKGGSSDKTALDIIKERYARGEIDKQEFEEKKKELS